MSMSQTSASTFARIQLIQMQFSVVMKRTTDITEESLDQLLLGIADDKRWIEKVSIYGLTPDNLCRAQLTLEIDWNEYDLQMSQARLFVALDEKKWRNNTAPEISDAIKSFNKFVKMYNLKTFYQITYTNECYKKSEQLALVRQTLGLVKGEPVQWVGTEYSKKMPVEELTEISVGLKFIV